MNVYVISLMGSEWGKQSHLSCVSYICAIHVCHIYRKHRRQFTCGTNTAAINSQSQWWHALGTHQTGHTISKDSSFLSLNHWLYGLWERQGHYLCESNAKQARPQWIGANPVTQMALDLKTKGIGMTMREDRYGRREQTGVVGKWVGRVISGHLVHVWNCISAI